MEGLKGGQALHGNLIVCMCVFLFGSKSAPFDGGSASPFIEEGVGFYKGEGLGYVLYLVLWLTST